MLMNDFYKLGINEEEIRKSIAAEILNYAANFLSLLYFVTPLIQIVRAYKRNLDKEAIPLPLIIFILLNCLLWLLNAISSGDLLSWIPLLISNGVGLIINSVILFLYLALLLQSTKRFLFYGIFVINVLVEISYLMFRYIILKDKENEEEEEFEFHYIGFAATIINVLMYTSPIVNVIKIVKKKSSELLPIVTLGVGFFCTLTFIAEGLVKYYFYYHKDENNQRVYAFETIISNGISFFFIVCQIGIWTYFRCTQKYRKDESSKISIVEQPSESKED